MFRVFVFSSGHCREFVIVLAVHPSIWITFVAFDNQSFNVKECLKKKRASQVSLLKQDKAVHRSRQMGRLTETLNKYKFLVCTHDDEGGSPDVTSFPSTETKSNWPTGM